MAEWALRRHILRARARPDRPTRPPLRAMSCAMSTTAGAAPMVAQSRNALRAIRAGDDVTSPQIEMRDRPLDSSRRKADLLERRFGIGEQRPGRAKPAFGARFLADLASQSALVQIERHGAPRSIRPSACDAGRAPGSRHSYRCDGMRRAMTRSNQADRSRDRMEDASDAPGSFDEAAAVDFAVDPGACIERPRSGSIVGHQGGGIAQLGLAQKLVDQIDPHCREFRIELANRIAARCRW